MRKSLLFQYICYLFLVFVASSCVSRKDIAYFQKAPNQSDTISIPKIYIPKIQPGDILSINIGSLNPAASSFLNPYSAMPVSTDVADATNGAPAAMSLTQSAMPNYLVNSDGTIEIPLIGNIKLSGLTTTEARDTIKNHSKRYVKEPTVNVRVMNYKISIMGEVVRPSVYVIPNEKITLPEALSLAGDLTIYGRRDNILIVRDIEGKKEFSRVNLNNRDLYNSPFYYLHNNDVIYVEPGKGRVAQTDRTYAILPVIFSALSLLVVFLSYTRTK